MPLTPASLCIVLTLLTQVRLRLNDIYGRSRKFEVFKSISDAYNTICMCIHSQRSLELLINAAQRRSSKFQIWFAPA